MKSLFGFQAPHFIKKKLHHRFFSCKFCKIFKNSFFWNTPGGSFRIIQWKWSSDNQNLFVWHYYEQALSSRYYLWYWITDLEKPCQQTSWLFCEGFNLWLFICCKTKLKYIHIYSFWKRYMCFLQNIHYLQKKCFYMEKKFYIEIFFYWKKIFYREKHEWKCRNIYLIWDIYFYAENVFVTNKI